MQMTKNTGKTLIGKGRFLHLMERDTWEFVHRPDVSGVVDVIALTDDAKLLLVEQFRHACNANVVELPAGLVGDQTGQADETVLAAADRELLEETGYRAGQLTELASGWSSPGHSTEQVTFVFATALSKVSDGGGVDDEAITVHEVPVGQVLAWLDQRRAEGTEIGVRVYASLCFAMQHLNQGNDTI